MKKKNILLTCLALTSLVTAETQYDLLGRQNSHVNSVVVRKVDAEKTAKASQNQFLAKTSVNDVTVKPFSGHFEYGRNTGMTKQYWFSTSSITGASRMNETAYFNKIKPFEDNDPARNAYNNDVVSLQTLGAGWSLKNQAFSLDGDYYKSTSGLEKSVVYVNYKKIQEMSKLSSSYKGSGVGVYLQEGGTPYSRTGYNISYTDLSPCSNNSFKNYSNDTHASKTFRVLETTAPAAQKYVYNISCNKTSQMGNFPENVYGRSILIGTHSFGSSAKSYSENAKRVDDFIYANRVVEFFSAGNAGTLSQGDKINDGYLSESAWAANAISVGAVSSYTNTYAKYNSHLNPYLGDYYYEKPEVVNYTDFVFPFDFTSLNLNKKTDGKYAYNEPVLTGTSASTPYMAGMVANLMSQHPFYKWHPEVVKALLLTAGVKDVKNADYSGNSSAVPKIPTYTSLSENNRSRYWFGNNGDFIKGDTIVFKESRILNNTTYNIAIAWLSSGTYMKENKRIPQDYILTVCQDNRCVSSHDGINKYDESPFRKVVFKTKSTSDLKIYIQRKRNNGGRLVLGYNLHEF